MENMQNAETTVTAGAVTQIMHAVVVRGVDERYHSDQMTALASNWRPLAEGLARLLVEYGHPVPAEWADLAPQDVPVPLAAGDGEAQGGDVQAQPFPPML